MDLTKTSPSGKVVDQDLESKLNNSAKTSQTTANRVMSFVHKCDPQTSMQVPVNSQNQCFAVHDWYVFTIPSGTAGISVTLELDLTGKPQHGRPRPAVV